MDRHGKCKIRFFLFMVGMIFALFFLAVGIYERAERSTIAKQKNEMIVMHPEQRDEVENTFHFYERKHNIHLLFLSGTFLSLMIGLLLGCEYRRKSRERRRLRERQKNLVILLEQLEQFQKGRYEVDDGIFSMDEYGEGQVKWEQIEETLRLLGYYFISFKDKLSEEENSTKSLITDISHQLKTPLSSLRMSYELAQENDLTEEEKIEFNEKERQEIQKLEVLLTELVQLSRLESHMIQIHKEPESIKKTITEAVNQVYIKAHERQIEIEVNLEDDPVLPHDRKWTVEALVNLLDNAIKYSNDNKTIHLHIKKLEQMLLIEVEDEGMGIDPEELHKIFQRFYRGKKARKLVKDGAGVGLYLSRKIIEEQGGTITAKRKQFGSLFRILLPL